MSETGNPDPPTTREEPRPPAMVDVRQQLAADRTLLAYVRTATALAALGFVVARFNLVLQETQRVSSGDVHAARAIGIVLVGAAALVLFLGLVQHRQVAQILAAHGDPLVAPRWPAMSVAAVALLGVIAVGVYLATGLY